MLIDNPCIEHWFPNEGVRERHEGTEGVCNPIGRRTISPNQKPQSSHGINSQRVHMEIAMAPIAYEAEDGLLGHQWEDMSLVS